MSSTEHFLEGMDKFCHYSLDRKSKKNTKYSNWTAITKQAQCPQAFGIDR